jgi:hypothetical protein
MVKIYHLVVAYGWFLEELEFYKINLLEAQ